MAAKSSQSVQQVAGWRRARSTRSAPPPITPGKDDEEYAQIKRHPAAGRALLEELGGFPEPVRRLVSDHHERLDGKGYPRGRAAAELDLRTRVLTACDVYDALVSDRVYRAAWTPERALGLLREDSGVAFDPQVVAALERVVGAAPSWVADLAPDTDISPRMRDERERSVDAHRPVWNGSPRRGTEP